jgi:hypothetical protein
MDDLKLIKTYQDGRASLAELYSNFLKLTEAYGWKKEVIYSIKVSSANGEVDVPVYCFLSPKQGESLWLLTGIHGEEPAGPNAVSRQIDLIGKLGQTIPMVVMPLLNPAGYYRNWRFHHVERSLERLNVTDSRHLIVNVKNPDEPIIAKPIHEIADVATKYILRLLETYPPVIYFDLHEDELISEGYVYSQGGLDSRDPIAAKTVELLTGEGLLLKMAGLTRFGEKVENGIVIDGRGGRVRDGSIDEFIANETYINEEKKILSKPFAKTSIVTETPTKGDLTLEDRIRAQENIVTHLESIWTSAMKN